HREAGYFPDLPGASYYPTASAEEKDPFAKFKQTAALLHETLKRPLFVAEFGFPASKALAFSGGAWARPLPGYPVSPQGQADFTRDLVAWGAKTGHLAGLRPWAPDFAGPVWGAMSYFDLQEKRAVARPGLDATTRGLRLAGRD